MKGKNQKKKFWMLGYLGFGVGAIGMDLSYGLFNSFLTNYLTDVLLLNSTFLLIVPVVARIWDGINDPMMGTIVDNTKSRFGKFRPWIFCGAILNAVALTMLFTNPGFEVSNTSVNIKLYIYAAVMYVLWGMTNTMIDIPYWSMVPALTSDPQKRNVVSAIPRFFSGFGQIVVSVFTVHMVTALGKGNDSVGYSRWAMIAGFVLIIGAIITVTTTKEHGALPPKEPFTLSKAFKTVKSNDQLLIFMLTALLFNTGWYITNAMAIYYFDKVMGDKSLLSSFAAIGGVGQAIGLFLLPVLSKKFSRRRVIQGAMITTMVGYAGMFVFGPILSSFVPFAIFGLLGCIGIGCIFVSQTVMLADIVDYGEYSLGYRSESIVFSMKGFLQKLAYTIQAIVIALGLKFSSYDATLIEQTPLTKNTISAMMFVIPPIFIILSFIIFTKKYKLYGELSDRVTAFTENRKKSEI
ncbi:MAG: MFS transporter [Clostridia bacterium]|nr:MFS transporter [Clostridia bacterium]MBQ7046762.1 MFS transporter [Oscillospiraceae bacterium]